MDTLGIEPRAFRMRSGCDTTTPCAPWYPQPVGVCGCVGYRFRVHVAVRGRWRGKRLRQKKGSTAAAKSNTSARQVVHVGEPMFCGP